VWSETDSAVDKRDGEIFYDVIRAPEANLMRNEGDGYLMAQKRRRPARIYHALRWQGQGQRAFDMMCERVVSREVHGSLLSQKQMIQDMIATSKAELEAARLLTLQAAWKMDQGGTKNALTDIAMIKFWCDQ